MRESVEPGSPVMIHVVGPEGLILQANAHWLEKMGYTEEEVLGRSPLEFLSERLREKETTSDLSRLLKDGIARDLPLHFRMKKGAEVALTYNNFPHFDHGGKFICAFAALSENPNAGIMAYDMVLGKGTWSPKACALLGIKKEMEEVYFAHHCSLLHKADLSAFENIFVMPLHPGKTIVQNYRIRGESGDFIPVSWWAQTVVHKTVIEEEKEDGDGNGDGAAVKPSAEASPEEEMAAYETQGKVKEPLEKINRILISSIIAISE